MKCKTCSSCLWWWDLYDNGERRCYNRLSRFFHEITSDGCQKHEGSLQKLAETHRGLKFDSYMATRKEKKH